MFSFTKKETLSEEQSLVAELSEEELAQVVGGNNNWGWHHHYHHHYSHGHWQWEKVWKPVRIWKPVWEHIWEPGCY